LNSFRNRSTSFGVSARQRPGARAHHLRVDQELPRLFWPVEIEPRCRFDVLEESADLRRILLQVLHQGNVVGRIKTETLGDRSAVRG
jgi:hypothetical protein